MELEKLVIKEENNHIIKIISVWGGMGLVAILIRWSELSGLALIWMIALVVGLILISIIRSLLYDVVKLEIDQKYVFVYTRYNCMHFENDSNYLKIVVSSYYGEYYHLHLCIKDKNGRLKDVKKLNLVYWFLKDSRLLEVLNYDAKYEDAMQKLKFKYSLKANEDGISVTNKK